MIPRWVLLAFIQVKMFEITIPIYIRINLSAAHRLASTHLPHSKNQRILQVGQIVIRSFGIGRKPNFPIEFIPLLFRNDSQSIAFQSKDTKLSLRISCCEMFFIINPSKRQKASHFCTHHRLTILVNHFAISVHGLAFLFGFHGLRHSHGHHCLSLANNSTAIISIHIGHIGVVPVGNFDCNSHHLLIITNQTFLKRSCNDRLVSKAFEIIQPRGKPRWRCLVWAAVRIGLQKQNCRNTSQNYFSQFHTFISRASTRIPPALRGRRRDL